MATAESMSARSDRVGGCLIWRGGLNPGGYGYVWHEGRNRAAHRLSYELSVGPIPNGLELLHSCDNPACIEPSHLTPGTHRENMQDMYSKKRRKTALGSRHGMSRLSEDAVSEIRRRYKPRCRINSSCALAREFGVSQATIWSALKGHTWKQA